GAPAPGARSGLRLPLVALVAGAVAVVLAAGVVVWNSGKRTADAEARAVQASVPSAQPSKGGASRPRTSRTPQGRAARPRLTPTPTRTPEDRTGSPTPGALAAFTLAYVRIQGASKINSAGVTCYTGSVNFAAGVDATRPGAAYSYQWLLDGRVVERGTSRLPAGGRGDYVTSRKLLTPSDGTHTITYRVTAPSARTRSARFTMCPTVP
ncbi:MAG: hypothetical protein HOW71_40665, partial [Nonomuraea sp.]|nr:hypothetical protein [Nonomuraea sp.]